MDLFAYSQLEDYGSMLENRGINIPRLRGIRYMALEEKNEFVPDFEKACTESAYWLIKAVPAWDVNSCISGNDHSEDYLNYYCNYEKDENGKKNWYPSSVKWNRLHGKHRKLVKFEAKKKVRAQKKQFDTFDKYVGRDDVLMVHARIGGYNWSYYGGPELEKQPWFLEKVDDAFDCTYCDIYVKVK